MTNNSIVVFCAGFATAVVALYGAGQHSPALCAIAGAAVPLAAQALYRGRSKRRPSSTTPAITVKVKATPAALAAVPAVDPAVKALERDITDALAGLGASRGQARASAKAAIAAGIKDVGEAIKFATAKAAA